MDPMDGSNSLLNSIITTRLGHIHQPACTICQDLGIVYMANLNPGIRSGAGSFELCECQESISLCDGEAPWQYYDQTNRSVKPCPSRPARLKLERLRILHRQSDIPRRYLDQFLASIQPDPVNTDLMRALEQSIEMIASLDQRDAVKGLYLHGPTGCGKTLLSCAILNEILRLYTIPVKYAKISRDILGKLQASFNPNSEIYGEGKRIEQELAQIPALVIDDFGIQRDTDWANQVLYDLIDARYENDLLTVFTSNESMASWKGIAKGRVLSRLKEMCREITIEMPDFRHKIHTKIQEQNLGAWGPA